MRLLPLLLIALLSILPITCYGQGLSFRVTISLDAVARTPHSRLLSIRPEVVPLPQAFSEPGPSIGEQQVSFTAGDVYQVEADPILPPIRLANTSSIPWLGAPLNSSPVSASLAADISTCEKDLSRVRALLSTPVENVRQAALTDSSLHSLIDTRNPPYLLNTSDQKIAQVVQSLLNSSDDLEGLLWSTVSWLLRCYSVSDTLLSPKYPDETLELLFYIDSMVLGNASGSALDRAVLMTALLRACGIPSFTVLGLVCSPFERQSFEYAGAGVEATLAIDGALFYAWVAVLVPPSSWIAVDPLWWVNEPHDLSDLIDLCPVYSALTIVTLPLTPRTDFVSAWRAPFSTEGRIQLHITIRVTVVASTLSRSLIRNDILVLGTIIAVTPFFAAVVLLRRSRKVQHERQRELEDWFDTLFGVGSSKRHFS